MYNLHNVGVHYYCSVLINVRVFFLIGGHLNRFMKKTWSIEDLRCCIICLKFIALLLIEKLFLEKIILKGREDHFLIKK